MLGFAHTHSRPSSLGAAPNEHALRVHAPVASRAYAGRHTHSGGVAGFELVRAHEPNTQSTAHSDVAHVAPVYAPSHTHPHVTAPPAPVLHRHAPRFEHARTEPPADTVAAHSSVASCSHASPRSSASPTCRGVQSHSTARDALSAVAKARDGTQRRPLHVRPLALGQRLPVQNCPVSPGAPLRAQSHAYSVCAVAAALVMRGAHMWRPMSMEPHSSTVPGAEHARRRFWSHAHPPHKGSALVLPPTYAAIALWHAGVTNPLTSCVSHDGRHTHVAAPLVALRTHSPRSGPPHTRPAASVGQCACSHTRPKRVGGQAHV